MKLRVVIMLVNDWLFKHLGEMLLINGVGGITVNIFYDRIIGRSSDAYYWGWSQWIFLIYCIGSIYAGWGWRQFVKVFKEDK